MVSLAVLCITCSFQGAPSKEVQVSLWIPNCLERNFIGIYIINGPLAVTGVFQLLRNPELHLKIIRQTFFKSMISIKYFIIPSILELSYESDCLETQTRRQHRSLSLHHQQPLSFSSITWFHKLTCGHNWVMFQRLGRDSSLLENSEKSSASCSLPLQLSVFGFYTWCSLANEGSQNHTFVYLRCVCKCYPQGDGWSLALCAHSQECVWLLGRAVLVGMAWDGGVQADGAVRGDWSLCPWAHSHCLPTALTHWGLYSVPHACTGNIPQNVLGTAWPCAAFLLGDGLW